MPAQLINGKALAEQIKLETRRQIIAHKLHPGLAVFLIGDDPASHLYVKLKAKACEQVGIDFHKYECESDICQADILASLEFLNNDPTIDAILVQMPLPQGFDEQEIIKRLNPSKDVDGFHPETLKKIESGLLDFVPGLSSGILRLIESTKQPLNGKTAVIVANSEIFSRPLVTLLEDKGVATQIALADDKNLTKKTVQADILIVAIGRPRSITAEMIKPGAIIIDVGTTKIAQDIVGDVDFESVKNKAGYITPVPGGVGPVTVAMLLENTVKLALKNKA